MIWDILAGATRALGKMTDERQNSCTDCGEINEKDAKCCKKCGSKKLRNLREVTDNVDWRNYVVSERSRNAEYDTKQLQVIGNEYAETLGKKYCEQCEVVLPTENMFCTKCTKQTVVVLPLYALKDIAYNRMFNYFVMFRHPSRLLEILGYPITLTELEEIMKEARKKHYKSIMEGDNCVENTDNPFIDGMLFVASNVFGAYKKFTNQFCHDFANKRYCGICGISKIEWYETLKFCLSPEERLKNRPSKK